MARHHASPVVANSSMSPFTPSFVSMSLRKEKNLGHTMKVLKWPERWVKSLSGHSFDLMFGLIKKAFDASLGSFLKFFLNDSDRIETAERLKIPIHGRNVVCHCFLYCFLR